MKKLLLLLVFLQFGQTFMAAEGGPDKRPGSPSQEPSAKKQKTGQSTTTDKPSSGPEITKGGPSGSYLLRQGPFFQPKIFLDNQGSGADLRPIFAQQEQERRKKEFAAAVINIKEEEPITIDDSSDEESGPQGSQVFHSPLPPKAATPFSWQAQPKPTSQQLRQQLEVLEGQHSAQMEILLNTFIGNPSLINHQNLETLKQQQQTEANSLKLQFANAIALEKGFPVFSHPISRLPIPIPLPPSVLAEAAAAQQLAPVAAAAVLEAAEESDGEEIESEKLLAKYKKKRAAVYKEYYNKKIEEKGEEFICLVVGCGKKFKKKDTASKHSREHWILENELYFCDGKSCEDCGKPFARRQNFVNHLTRGSHNLSEKEANKYTDKLEKEWFVKQQESQLAEAAAAAPTTAKDENQIPEAAAAALTIEDENQKLYDKYYKYDEDQGKYLCTECKEKEFASGWSLKKHIRDLHGEKVFQCSHCPKGWTATRKADYIEHVTRYPDMKAHRAARYLPTHSYNCIIPGCPYYQTDKIFSLQEIIEHCRVLHGIEEEDLEVDDFKITD